MADRVRKFRGWTKQRGQSKSLRRSDGALGLADANMWPEVRMSTIFYLTSINVDRSYNTVFLSPSINQRRVNFETSDWITSDGGGIAKCRMWWG